MKFKKITAIISALAISTSFFMPCLSVSATEDVLAFPGAEGGGKYSLGARGSSERSVYHVTNLNASGKGSFADAVGKGGRIIVFDVGGTIELDKKLTIKKSNLTILGQTAPGDGITISGGDVQFDDEMSNIIMRYMRIRPTDKNGSDTDGLGGRWNSNIIVDHCSLSWSVDELLTLYGGSSDEDKKTVGSNLTVQNTLASESLRMSNHFKGAHGYGGIWGATNSSWHHNLLAHHDSRSPRLDRELQKTDIQNNVIYNWGQTNSAYGAEPHSSSGENQNGSYVNYVSNYYKYGPSTKSSIRYRIFDVSNDDNITPYAQFYMNGNFVFGNEQVSENNVSGVNNSAKAEFMEVPFDMGNYTLTSQTAEDAYDDVLANVGATLPKRDAVDARIISDVKNQTGRVINTADEVGGLIYDEPEYRTFEIPEEWIAEHNLSEYGEVDIINDGEFKGYTLIEAYVNDWTLEQEAPTNPEITVMSPAIASVTKTVNEREVNNGDWTVVDDNEEITYNAVADAVGGYEVTKMELYDRNTLIKSYDSNEINDSFTLPVGEHYLTCRAYNTRGEKTQSTTSIVYVRSTAGAGSYQTAQIGKGTFDGEGGAWLDDDGVYTVAGSGVITNKSSDACQFMYKEVTGDFDISVKVENIPKFENKQVSGLMVRETLDANSRMAMIADGWLKYGENVRVFSRKTKNTSASETFFSNADGTVISNSSKYNSQSAEHRLPKYMRITRTGDELTMYVSDGGKIWTDNPRQPMTVTMTDLPDTLYVGLATDAADNISVKDYYSMASFSNLILNGESDVEIEDDSAKFKFPFSDERFDSVAWAFQNGEMAFETDCSSSPVSGNSSIALTAWSYAKRSFDPQSSGQLNFTVDYLTLGEAKPQNDDTTFKLLGYDADSIEKELATLNIHLTNGCGINGETTADALVEGKVWYKVKMSLDYDTGKGKVSVTPYTEYNSLLENYVTGDTLYTAEFDFDTSIPVSSFRMERLGGGLKYFDNVTGNVTISGDADTDSNITVTGGKIRVFATEAATLYLAEYENGTLVSVEITPVNANEAVTASIPDGEYNAMLWDSRFKPLCDSMKSE